MLPKQSALIGRIAKAVSPVRLDKYYDPRTEQRWEALANYAWNIAICEAFYPLLNAIEVVLRNSLDDAISGVYPAAGCTDVHSWLDAHPSPLSQYAQADVHRAKEKLFGVDRKTRALLPPSRPIVHGDVVAALDFGFWTGLLHNSYLYQSARDQRFWPHLLPSVFPHATPMPTHPSAVSRRLNDVRQFRNRIFHHEPIWKRANLSAVRDEITELIGWMSPEAKRLVVGLDRVPDVLDPAFRRRLRLRVFAETRR